MEITREIMQFSPTKKKKLLTYHSLKYSKNFHPLKNKKIKLDRIKTIIDAPKQVRAQKIGILSRKYSIKINQNAFPFVDITDNLELMFSWLREEGIQARLINKTTCLLLNLHCSLSYVLIYANKKRAEKHLKPFFIDWLSEN